MSKLKWNRLPFPRFKLILVTISTLIALVLLSLAVPYPLFEETKSFATTANSHLTNNGIFTAYTSRRSETKSNPYITADGSDLRKKTSCVVANNKLQMGTKVEIEGFGICEVRDRIGFRSAANRFDIYMGQNLSRAREFGKRRLLYRIIS
jgi:3D (Asp-Asp-Asp) domain-containing protein